MSVAANLFRMIGFLPSIGTARRTQASPDVDRKRSVRREHQPSAPLDLGRSRGSGAAAQPIQPVLAATPAFDRSGAGTVADLDAIDLASDPSLADLVAAIELVSSGLATRVVLSGVRPWPGLLWQVNQLARESDLSIAARALETGRVEIEVKGNPDDGG